MSDRPRAEARFFKGHGLGNDYIVVEAGDAWPLTEHAIQAVCDRSRGPGSDGLVVLLSPQGPPYGLRMFNPDGSEFERSGNGLRIFGAYLASLGRVGREPFEVSVGGDSVRLEVAEVAPGGIYDVKVEMGRAGFSAEDVGIDEGALEGSDRILGPDGPISFVGVSVGNPHCVVFLDDPTHDDLARLGPHLTAHPAFKGGTNVQLARATGRATVEALVWERGVGPTASSGTSACAVAAAAVRSELVDAGPVEVRMLGGTLYVDVSEDMELTLRGPAQEIYTGELSAGFLEVLGSPA